MLELLAFFETEALHDFRHAIGRAEVAHEVVLEADVEARVAPGSPWRAQRPRNWRSMRRDSWRSVPMT